MPSTQTTHIEHLCFDNTPIAVMEHNNAPWFTSAELAKALGYSSSNAISKIYNRNEIEFDDTDSTVISVMTNGNLGGYRRIPTRIFSQDGCNLFAMLAKGPKAIAFRRWVKKVLRDFRFRANATNEAVEEFFEENDEPHSLDGQQPDIFPLAFNGDDVPFTYYKKRFWLNSFNLAQLLKLDVKRPSKKIGDIWRRNIDDMPEDGSRLVTWCRIGRTSGERVFDLPTCKAIAIKAGYNDINFAAVLWLQDLNERLLNNNTNKLLPNMGNMNDSIHKAKVLNNLLGDHELGDRAHVHQLIDGLLDFTKK